MRDLIDAQSIGLYLLFLVIGVLFGFMIGLATDRRKPKERPAHWGREWPAGTFVGAGSPVPKPPAPEKPQWLRDAERGEADDIERMPGAPPPYFGGSHLTGGHRSH